MKSFQSKRWVRAVVRTVYILAVLFSAFWALEYSTRPHNTPFLEHISTFEGKYFLLNIATIGVTYAAVWLVTNRIWLSGMVCGAFWSLAAIGNHYVIKLHSMPLSFLVMRNLRTALNVLSPRYFSIDKKPLLIGAVMCVLLAAGVWLAKAEKKHNAHPGRSVIASVAAVALSVAVIWTGYFGSAPLKPMHTISWTWTEAYYKYGFVGCTLESYFQLRNVVKQPETYDEDAAEALLAQSAAQREGQTPDIVLILNETWYDLSLITDLQTDAPYNARIAAMDNAATGYAIVPGAGGGTNSSEYELLTANSMKLMPGVTPFNSLELEDAAGIVSHVKKLGYATLGAHDAPGSSYSRGLGYAALGFEDIHFEQDFVQRVKLNGVPFGTDESLYKDLLKWYNAMPQDKPRFAYLLTIQNHGSWNYSAQECDTVHAATDYGEYDSSVDEYLSRIETTDAAFAALTETFAASDRPVIVCMVGDHAPSFAASIADASLSEEERNLLLRQVPLVIWANFPLDTTGLGVMSINYVVPTLLEMAGMATTPYYDFLLRTKEEVPVVTSYGAYCDAQGNVYRYGEGSLLDDRVTDLFCLEYHNIENGQEHRMHQINTGI